MEFLNKLYSSNNFGIGLFAVICFLVVAFLVVLFFGKKDEKKRKNEVSATNTFKETSAPQKVENKIENKVENNVSPITSEPIETLEPVAPLNYEEPIQTFEVPKMQINTPTVNELPKTEPIVQPLKVEPIKLEPEKITPDIIKPTPTLEPMPAMNVAPQEVKPVINEPIINEPVINEPIINFEEPIKEPAPIDFMMPNLNEPQPVAPLIPDEEEILNVTPTPVVNETPTINIPQSVTPIIEEPQIGDIYYKPTPASTPSIEDEIKVPSIDFDAIAQSINNDLTSIEQSSEKVTPISEVINEKPVYSSVYIHEPVRPIPAQMDMPKKIDLPKRKDGI